jgi:CSLREA domain-containing protein
MAANTNAAVNECSADNLDTIGFNLGTGTPTINVTSPLPEITEPLTIDGATGGATRIELNGAGAGADTDGLTVSGGGSTLKGLVINRFSQNGIFLDTGGGNTIQNCYLGTNAAGTLDLGNASSGIYLESSSNNTIGGTSGGTRNLISGNNAAGVAIFLGSSNNSVLGNYIGTDVSGALDLGNGIEGIAIDNSANNIIGGVTGGNVISGNDVGLQIISAGSTGNQVLGNFIGVNAAGTAAIGNSQEGIVLDGASSNIIGGTATGARNVISGNSSHGVLITSNLAVATNNQVLGNFIGTDITGTLARGNAGSGVSIQSASELSTANNFIGGSAVNAGNIISGNNGSGVLIVGPLVGGNTVQGNFIGTNAAGTAVLGNAEQGVWLANSPNNLIGGLTTGARNVISGHNATGRTGVLIDGVSATANVVHGNFIGTNVTGMSALGNANGVVISGGGINVIGGADPNARNLISGNTSSGVWVTGGTATGNQVQGNYIGTNAAGTASLGNNALGVLISDSAANNLVGGTTTAARNLISGNNAQGLGITGASNNTVQNNYIGTDVTGTVGLGNQLAGLAINNGANNQIGGVGLGNLISGNGAGIEILGVSATGNQVMGNLLGTNAAGTVALLNVGTDVATFGGASNNSIGGTAIGAGNVMAGNPNGNSVTFGGLGTTGNQLLGNRIGTNTAGTAVIGGATHGVVVGDSATNTIIGGTTTGARNLIAGSSQNGIWILGNGTTGTQVMGNYIGTDVTGTIDLGNGLFGVEIENSANNIIGGTAAGAGNLISGNNSWGVQLEGANATGNLVEGNFIGTNGVGSGALPNSGGGVLIVDTANNNTIGGTAAGAENRIAFNGGAGVVVAGAGSLGNAVRANLIFGNASLGLDLIGDGVTANDLGDVDTGPNRLQNFPVVSSVSGAGELSGSLDSTVADSAYPVRIEFFANATCDGSNNGEGEVFLGFVSVAAPGAFTFNFTPIVGKPFITATATDSGGNTSEFSACRMVGDVPVITVNTAADTVAADGACSLREAITAANTNAAFNGCIAGVPGLDNIVFSIGAGTPTINVTSALPAITEPLTINGATGGATRVELNGFSAGANVGGLTIAAGNSAIRNLVINRFTADGITLQTGGSNVIEGCLIGLNAAGTAALANTGSGILISGSANNTVGGASVAARNVISGNGSDGVVIRLAGATGNSVLGNFIGTNATGAAVIGNGGYGVAVTNSAANNTIGGTAGARNLISGNIAGGVLLRDPATIGNQLLGNYIGTDLNGVLDLGNSGTGVLLDNAANNTIGGTSAGAGNLISGNNQDGLVIRMPGATGNSVLGNLIGSNAAGASAIGNTGVGVAVTNGAANNTIGGTVTGARNLISGNGGNGVLLRDAGTGGNSLLGNFIGVDAAGTGALANATNGVEVIDAANNTIGGTGTGAGNLIAFNPQNGVLVNGVTSTGNRVLGNLVFSNGAPGIDLGGNGVSPNDANDADTGPNQLQNFPLINFVTGAGALSGQLDSTAGNSAYPVRIEFFANSACDGSGNGEGEVFLGFVSVAAPGAFTFNFTPPVGKPFITATGTDANGNTSEFSTCEMVGGAIPVITVNTMVDTMAADGLCSLREAITAANTNAAFNGCAAGLPGLDNIVFALGAGTPSIAVVGTALPPITEAVTIDGATGGATRVELNGGGKGGDLNGLDITAGNSAIRSLVINGFTGVGIRLRIAGGNTIQNCLIGLDSAGTAALPNDRGGVSILDTANNLIGGSVA